MSLLTVLIVLVIVGLVMWAVNQYLPMQPTIKTILNVVVVIIVVLWLLQGFGLLGTLDSVRIR